MVVLLYCVWLSVYDCVRLCTIVYCLWLYTGVLCLAVTVWRDWGVCVTVLVCKCVWLCVFDCVFGCVLLCVLVIHIVCVTVCVWWVLWHSGCDFQFRCFLSSFPFQPTFPSCAANDNCQWSSGSSSSISSSGGSCNRFHVDAALLSLLGANQGTRSNAPPHAPEPRPITRRRQSRRYESDSSSGSDSSPPPPQEGKAQGFAQAVRWEHAGCPARGGFCIFVFAYNYPFIDAVRSRKMSLSIVKVVLEGESSWTEGEREEFGLTPLDLMTLKQECAKKWQ